MVEAAARGRSTSRRQIEHDAASGPLEGHLHFGGHVPGRSSPRAELSWATRRSAGCKKRCRDSCPIRPIVLGPRSAGRRHVLLGGRQRRLDARAGRGLARRRARQAARGQDFDHRRHRRPAARRSGAHRRRRPSAQRRSQCCRRSTSRSATRSSARPAIRSTSPTPATARLHLTLTDGCDQRQDSPRRHAIDRGPASPRRRARHDRDQHPAAGRRSHPRRSARACRTRRRLKELVGTTAKLEFRLVADPGDPPSEVDNARRNSRAARFRCRSG